MSSSLSTTKDNFVLTKVVRRYTVPLKGPNEAKGPLRSSPRFEPRAHGDEDDIVPLVLPPGLSKPGHDERSVVLQVTCRRQLRRVKFCIDLRQLAKTQEKSFS